MFQIYFMQFRVLSSHVHEAEWRDIGSGKIYTNHIGSFLTPHNLKYI